MRIMIVKGWMKMTLHEVQEMDSQYYMNTFGERTPLCFTEGKGITLTATDGKTYKDLQKAIQEIQQIVKNKYGLELEPEPVKIEPNTNL